MTGGAIGILNVGAGDTKLVFDKDNPAECIRAARIVTDMLRRGYALMIEVTVNGEKKTQRVYEFREDTFEYIIADLDPTTAAKADLEELHEQSSAAPAPWQANQEGAGSKSKKGRGVKTKAVSAHGVSGIAIGRVAGG